MLILGGFVVGRQDIMSLDLTDDRQAVDDIVPAMGDHAAHAGHIVLRRRIAVILFPVALRFSGLCLGILSRVVAVIA